MSSLTLSIIDGVFYSLMVGFGEAYFVPYAVSLGVTDFEIGMMTSLPLLAGSLVQLAIPWLVHLTGQRKSVVRTFVLLQSFSFLPLLAVPYLSGGRAWWLILFILLYWVFQLAGTSAWQSWMGDLVPASIRGNYFSLRSRWLQLATFLGIVGAGILLEKKGFLLIFLLALSFRFGSFYVLKKQEEPPYRSPPESHFTFLQFVKKMSFNNYGLFVLYSALFAVAHYLSGPYFNPYLLRGLKLTYLQFMLSQAAFVASKSLFLPLWGHYSDRYGSRKLLSLAGYLCPFIPLVWIFVSNLVEVIIIQILSGFIWAGMELCAFNFILDCTTPEKRTRCVAYYQVFVGLGSVVGALSGAFILAHPLFFAGPYLSVFLISGMLRLAVSLYFLPWIRDIRLSEPISYRTLLIRMFLLLKPGSS